MKFIQATIFVLFSITNSYALTLAGSNGVEILAIDGKVVKSSFFTQQAPQLTKGNHQIVIRYSNQFNQDQLLESRPHIFTLDLQQDTEISVQSMNTQRQAEKRIKSGLIWQIITTDNQYEIKESDILQGKGFMPYSDIEALVSSYNKENSIITSAVKVDSAEVKSSVPIAVEAVNDNKSPLITLYQQASQSEKKAFRLWLLEQDMK